MVPRGNRVAVRPQLDVLDRIGLTEKKIFPRGEVGIGRLPSDSEILSRSSNRMISLVGPDPCVPIPIVRPEMPIGPPDEGIGALTIHRRHADCVHDVAFHLMAASVASDSLLSMTRAEARADERVPRVAPRRVMFPPFGVWDCGFLGLRALVIYVRLTQVGDGSRISQWRRASTGGKPRPSVGLGPAFHQNNLNEHG